MSTGYESPEELAGDELPEQPSTQFVSKNLGMGSALWESVAGEWLLLKCGCSEGFEAGSPPADLGKYEGEIVRKLCEPIVR